jgi:hypothetical protein
VATIKEFEVAAAPKTDAPEGTQFNVPDVKREGKEQTFTTITAYEPDEGQFAVLMATTGRGASDADRIAGFINFFVNILDERGADYLTGRLLTPTFRDPFGINEVEAIMDWLSSEWTGNPTRGSSGSTPSPLTDGPRSTGSSLLT